MTMKIKVSNEGPEPYVAVVKTGDGTQLGELKVGEFLEVHIWPGREVKISEK